MVKKEDYSACNDSWTKQSRPMTESQPKERDVARQAFANRGAYLAKRQKNQRRLQHRSPTRGLTHWTKLSNFHHGKASHVPGSHVVQYNGGAEKTVRRHHRPFQSALFKHITINGKEYIYTWETNMIGVCLSLLFIGWDLNYGQCCRHSLF